MASVVDGMLAPSMRTESISAEQGRTQDSSQELNIGVDIMTSMSGKQTNHTNLWFANGFGCLKVHTFGHILHASLRKCLPACRHIA